MSPATGRWWTPKPRMVDMVDVHHGPSLAPSESLPSPHKHITFPQVRALCTTVHGCVCVSHHVSTMSTMSTTARAFETSPSSPS